MKTHVFLFLAALSVISVASEAAEVSCSRAEIVRNKREVAQKAVITCGMPEGEYSRVHLELSSKRRQTSLDTQDEFTLTKGDVGVAVSLWATVTTDGNSAVSNVELCWDGEKVFLRNSGTFFLLTEDGAEALSEGDLSTAWACFYEDSRGAVKIDGLWPASGH